MSLQQWLDNSWIATSTPSREEIAGLVQVAERNLADASLEGLSPDGRFSHAYDAVRCLCQAALTASGFVVPKGGRQHERVIESLKFTLGSEWADETDYFDLCRRNRHKSIYEQSGINQPRDADQLLESAKKLLTATKNWLQLNQPDLI